MFFSLCFRILFVFHLSYDDVWCILDSQWRDQGRWELPLGFCSFVEEYTFSVRQYVPRNGVYRESRLFKATRSNSDGVSFHECTTALIETGPLVSDWTFGAPVTGGRCRIMDVCRNMIVVNLFLAEGCWTFTGISTRCWCFMNMCWRENYGQCNLFLFCQPFHQVYLSTKLPYWWFECD